MIDGFKIGAAAASLAASYEFYFGDKPMTTIYRTTTMTDAEYEACENAYAAFNKALDRAKRHAKDVMDWPTREPEENLSYSIDQMMDSAHEILDLAHEFKQAVKK